MSSSDQNNFSFFGFIKEVVETVVIVLVLVILIRNFIGEPRWIPSGSMRPTLIEGDRIFIEKVTKFISEPKRGEIIVFYPPFEELEQDNWSIFTRLVGFFNKDQAFIKRIIGMPGDKFEIKTNFKNQTNQILVNGKAIKEPYIKDNSFMPCTKKMHCGPMTIPEDSYFMMGDNRSNSQDSRYWGYLPKDRVIGRTIFRFWPINRWGIFKKPKYEMDSKKAKEIKPLNKK